MELKEPRAFSPRQLLDGKNVAPARRIAQAKACGSLSFADFENTATEENYTMLTKSKAIAFGVTTALLVAIAAPGGGQGTDLSGEREAAASGGFELTWFSVDGGGGTGSGGDFVLRGTIGQPDAGDHAGGDFTLRGGFGLPAAGCGDCPTDSNGSGDTEAFDLAILLGAWGPVTPDSACLDADENGFIEAFDLAVLLGSWGPCL